MEFLDLMFSPYICIFCICICLWLLGFSFSVLILQVLVPGPFPSEGFYTIVYGGNWLCIFPPLLFLWVLHGCMGWVIILYPVLPIGTISDIREIGRETKYWRGEINLNHSWFSPLCILSLSLHFSFSFPPGRGRGSSQSSYSILEGKRSSRGGRTRVIESNNG